MELVYVALISGIFSLFGIYLLYSLQTRKMDQEQKYNIKRFKLGKKYKLQELELPKKLEKRTLGQSAIEKIIEKYAPQILGNEEDEYEQEGGIGEIIANIVKTNPEIVEKVAPDLINRFLPKEKEDKKDYIGTP